MLQLIILTLFYQNYRSVNTKECSNYSSYTQSFEGNKNNTWVVNQNGTTHLVIWYPPLGGTRIYSDGDSLFETCLHLLNCLSPHLFRETSTARWIRLWRQISHASGSCSNRRDVILFVPDLLGFQFWLITLFLWFPRYDGTNQYSHYGGLDVRQDNIASRMFIVLSQKGYLCAFKT